MNRVVLITGASRGIGSSIANRFAQEKDIIIINYNSSEERALEVKKKIESKYSTPVMVIRADISNEEEVKEMIKQVIDIYGKIDILVNNAGVAIDTLVEDKKVEDFEKTLKVNLIGAFLCARECSKYMEEGSSIINITSTNGIDTYYPYSLDYDASKAGLISLTHNLAVEYSPKIRVNAVAPGWVNTEMNKELDKEYIEEECEKILIHRFAEPEEIASVAVFLASPEARYINSEVIRVDGGLL